MHSEFECPSSPLYVEFIADCLGGWGWRPSAPHCPWVEVVYLWLWFHLAYHNFIQVPFSNVISAISLGEASWASTKLIWVSIFAVFHSLKNSLVHCRTIVDWLPDLHHLIPRPLLPWPSFLLLVVLCSQAFCCIRFGYFLSCEWG